MKKEFLLIVVPALLVALGFAQTPAASNTDLTIKGCLGGSDGNYTVAEDNTGKIFKITTSSADLKPHLGQGVTLIGHKADAAENSLAVTEVNMISEHCTAAAAASAAASAAPAATVSTPSETVIIPVAAAAPASAAPEAAVTTPSETVSTPPAAPAPVPAPDTTVSPRSETAVAPPAAAAAPAAGPDATVSAPLETASVPAAAAAAPVPAEPVSTPVADGVLPTEPVGPTSETASTPAVPAATAPRASTSRSVGMLVPVVVVVLLIGAGVPLYNRWRKRKLLEQTRGQNLSFTKEAKSDPGTSDTTEGRKAA